MLNDTAIAAANLLDRAADRISKPGAWCQGMNALDASGRGALYHSTSVSWCARGALAYEASQMEGVNHASMYTCAEWAEAAVIRVVGCSSLPTLNDFPGQTAAEVAECLRKTAKAIREGKCSVHWPILPGLN